MYVEMYIYSIPLQQNIKFMSINQTTNGNDSKSKLLKSITWRVSDCGTTRKWPFSPRNSTKFSRKLPNLDTFLDFKISKNFTRLYGYRKEN